MLFYLNRPLILEQAIRDALIEYFEALKVSDFYKKWHVNITCEHPFSLMLPSFTFNPSIFPSIVITSNSDSKPSELTNLAEMQQLILEKKDLPLLKDSGYAVCDRVLEELGSCLEKKEYLIGVANIVRRQEKIAIEIWSENIQLKNELYEMVRLFVTCGINKAMEREIKNNNLVVFDNTVQGERSGNYNYDFGVTLAGARITFDADYFIEQSIIDTELTDKSEIEKRIIWEVKDYVKRDKK